MLLPEQILELENLAGVGLTPRECAKYFGIHATAFLNEFEKEDSTLRYAYERGQLVAKTIIELKQLELAQSGNFSATENYRKALLAQNFQTQKERLLNGEL